VVPYTRGAETSRPVTPILEEARRLLESGAKEITLLGQNVNAWHGEAADGKIWNLGRLLHAVAELPGMERLRYTTSHPRDMHEELIEAHRDIPALAPFLHLPVQSGSNRILQAMNRGHTAEDYKKIIERVRAVKADMAFSSDFIVGFPGESDQDFEDTLRLVRDVNFSQAYSFKYSARPGTPAASMTAQVPEEVKAQRLAQMQDLLFSQQRAFNEKFIGARIPVLFDRPGKTPGQGHGRSAFMQSVHFDGAGENPGRMVQVKIRKATQNSLEGEACASC
jgi:tRNA-2-methylthio-N6-dimethylallyladenosine synthase